MSIVFDRVTKVIGHNTVIDNINCTMQTGSITGLKGINGSGKTMMMRLIAGLIYPTEGQVIVDGKVIGKEVSFPTSLGVMLENPAFLDTYIGYDNLKLLTGINRSISDIEIEQALSRVGLLESKEKIQEIFPEDEIVAINQRNVVVILPHDEKRSLHFFWITALLRAYGTHKRTFYPSQHLLLDWGGFSKLPFDKSCLRTTLHTLNCKSLRGYGRNCSPAFLFFLITIFVISL